MVESGKNYAHPITEVQRNTCNGVEFVPIVQGSIVWDAVMIWTDLTTLRESGNASDSG
jgi:hypothetical protein